MNATVRDNILFGEEYNEERYKKAIFSCCLERDLEIMTDGDQTEVCILSRNVSLWDQVLVLTFVSLKASHEFTVVAIITVLWLAVQ